MFNLEVFTFVGRYAS